MIKYYVPENHRLAETDSCVPGCWINVINPDRNEIQSLIDRFSLEPDFIRAALDEEESSRIETEDENTLIIIDTPYVEKNEDNLIYLTVPIGIIVTPKNVLTISLRENALIEEFAQGVVKDVNPALRTQFVLMLMMRMSTRFLQYLKQIDRISNTLERELRKSMKNKELVMMLDINKSLVYFSTSLKANEITIAKLTRGKHLKLYEEDQDLLDDVLIEIKQAIEMASIYSSVLSGTTDSFASIISNNLNNVMKILASVTIVVSIPTFITGFYGMNIGADAIPLDAYWWAPVIISLLMMSFCAWLLWKKDMF